VAVRQGEIAHHDIDAAVGEPVEGLGELAGTVLDGEGGPGLCEELLEEAGIASVILDEEDADGSSEGEGSRGSLRDGENMACGGGRRGGAGGASGWHSAIWSQ